MFSFNYLKDVVKEGLEFWLWDNAFNEYDGHYIVYDKYIIDSTKTDMQVLVGDTWYISLDWAIEYHGDDAYHATEALAREDYIEVCNEVDYDVQW